MKEQPFWMNPREVTLKDGTTVLLRPSRLQDLEPAWDMFSSLSEATLEFLPIPFPRERVEGWFKDIDYSKALPILGFVGDRHIASASLNLNKMPVFQHRAEFGINVHDDYQDKGLGTILTRYMIDIARSLGLKKVDLMVVAHNDRAINVYKKQGFVIEGRLKMNHFNNVLNDYCDEYKMRLMLD
jgi:putative acetyltransferase